MCLKVLSTERWTKDEGCREGFPTGAVTSRACMSRCGLAREDGAGCSCHSEQPGWGTCCRLALPGGFRLLDWGRKLKHRTVE